MVRLGESDAHYNIVNVHRFRTVLTCSTPFLNIITSPMQVSSLPLFIIACKEKRHSSLLYFRSWTGTWFSGGWINPSLMNYLCVFFNCRQICIELCAVMLFVSTHVIHVFKVSQHSYIGGYEGELLVNSVINFWATDEIYFKFSCSALAKFTDKFSRYRSQQYLTASLTSVYRTLDECLCVKFSASKKKHNRKIYQISVSLNCFIIL